MRVYPASAPPLVIRGQNVAGYLAVPCWKGNDLQTLQFIPPDGGDKLNLPGAPLNDGFFTVGQITDRAYIVEGIGQAWAVNQATGAAAVVCFGASRMTTVAKTLRTQYPAARLVIVPDRGKEEQAGKIAATASGEWVAMPADKPGNYDANDYAQEYGTEALLTLLDASNQAIGRDSSDLNDATDSQVLPEQKFERVSLADVLTNPPNPQSYVWGECIPGRALTLLAAHGGTGKSLLAMQLAAHVAIGRPFLGLDTARTKTLFFSAEDATDTIRRRFASLCQADTLDPKEVAENLIILDATASPCLFHEVAAFGVKTAEPTTHYAELKAMIEDEGVGFLIVDNASDSFGANPIDRQAVTKFIRALVLLVRDAGGAVLLLSHVNKNTSRNAGKQTDTEGYADSAAWHNAARSRLFLNALDDQGNTLTLAHNKNNYGKKQAPLNLAFREDGSGLTIADAVHSADFNAGDASASMVLRTANRLPVLKLIHEFYKREEWISSAKESSTSNAYAMLRDDVDYPYLLTKRDCLALVRDCERDGLLTKETYKKPSRHDGKRWGLTVKGLEFIGATLDPAPSKQAELKADKLDELLPCPRCQNSCRFG